MSRTGSDPPVGSLIADDGETPKWAAERSNPSGRTGKVLVAKLAKGDELLFRLPNAVSSPGLALCGSQKSADCGPFREQALGDAKLRDYVVVLVVWGEPVSWPPIPAIREKYREFDEFNHAIAGQLEK